MGVHGLWRLIDASGKPVPLETLENKVLAVDVSIWLHQAIKGFQDSKGAPLPNAHLLGIYHRVCKLLYFKIKPVFVFDGGVPVLKKETIAKRNQLKARNTNDANKIQKQILNTLLKHTAVNKVLSEQTKSQLPVKPQKQHDQQNQDDLFKLPPSQLDSTFSSSDDEEYTSTSDSSPTKYWDIHTIDEKSAEFRSLPADVRHEILTDLKETRKQSSWGRIHELPTESNEFSGYQMKRLLKRFSIQSSLEETEKEMGGHSLSLKELESLLNDHGVVTGDSVGNRIASDENTRYLYIKDVKKALEKARVESLNPIIEEEKEICIKDGSNQNKGETSSQDNLKKNVGKETPDLSSVSSKGDLKHSNETFDDKAGTSREDSEIINDLEYQRDLNLAIQLSLQEVPSSSNVNVDGQSKPKSKKTSCSGPKIKNLEVFSAAMGYMMDYGGLTPAGVNEILMGKKVKDDESESDEEKSIISKLLEEEFYSSKNSNSRDSNQGNKNSELVEADLKLVEVDVKLVERDIKLVEKDENLVKTDEHKKSDVIEVDRNFSNTKESERKDLREGVSIQDSVNTIEGNNQEINIQKNLTKNIITAKTIESNSSESAVKRGEIKLVTENDSVDSNSSDDDFVEVPVDTKNESSDEDDFIEISEKSKLKNNNERTVSGSESEDDFMEVSEKEKILEVVIDKNKMEDDEDIFSDIFSADKEEKIDLTKLLLEKNKKTLKEQLINQVENKQDDQIKSESLERKNFLEQKLQNPNKVESVDLSKLMVKSDKKSVHFSLETNDNDLKIIGEDVKKIKDDIKEKHKSEVKEVVATKINEDQEVEVRKTTVSLSTDELKQMEEYFEREKESLIVERSNKERLANNITDQMYQEAQELLQLFGVPYIVAPMEAEAQCAFLNEANLTDGTITDDSDIWLFGGKTVYRNFFNQSKRVMEFNSENIEHHFNLSRLKLIQLSLLVGSDYTVGLQGVGPVTALEILAAFPSYNENAALTYQQVISGLIRFRNWFKQGRIAGPGKAALRTKLRNLEVTESFPNPNVAKAYLEPEIETSREKFSWGKPDIVALTDYAKQKFGWSQKKSEEILKPVVKRLQENRMQSTIKDYFKTKHKINVTDLSEKMSKRVKSAVNRMGNIGDDDDGEEVEEKVSKGGKGRKKRGTDEDNVKKPRGNKKALNDTENEENPGSSKNTSEDANIEAVGIKKTRSRKKASKNDDNDDTGKKTMSRKKALNAIDSKEYPISSNKISTEDKPLRSKKVLKAIEVEDKETSIKKASNDVEIEENPNSSKNITGIENSTSSKNIADVVEAECIKKTRSRKKTLKNDANEDQAMKKPRSENNLEESEGNTKSRTRNKSLREEYLEDDNKVVSAQNLDLNEHSESSEINDESTLINKLAVMERLKACCKNTPGLSKYTIKAKELKKAKQKKNSSKSDTNNSTDFSMEIDEDLLELHNVEIASVKKVKEIEDSMKEQFEKNLKRTLHAKEVIHQKERDRSEMVRSKMRAIEAFRKSKNGPGFVKKRPKFVRKPKDDAELSEDSSDD